MNRFIEHNSPVFWQVKDDDGSLLCGIGAEQKSILITYAYVLNEIITLKVDEDGGGHIS